MRLRLDVPCSKARLVSLALSGLYTETLHKSLWIILDRIGSCNTEAHGPSGRVAADVALVRALRKRGVAGYV